jgi:carboxypeptidase Taq
MSLKVGVVLFCLFLPFITCIEVVQAQPEVKIEIRVENVTKKFEENFKELKSKIRKIYYLNSIMALLMWDQHVIMPSKGSNIRSKQVSNLSKMIYQKQTSSKLKNLIEIVKEQSKGMNLTLFDSKLIHLIDKNFKTKTALSSEITQRVSSLQFQGFDLWRKAKENNDFKSMIPIIKEWIELKKTIAKALDPSMNTYDVLIDEYDPGMTTKEYDNIFEKVKQFIIPFIKKIKESNKPTEEILLNKGEFDISKQKELNEKIIKALGFSFDHGRLDSSAHPITKIISNWDVRITTRYEKESFLSSLKFSIHESGHAIYEQNLPSKYFGTPVGDAHGMSVHESQSLLWERHVGLSKPFWNNILPQIKEYFPHLSPELTVEKAYKEVNQVNPGLIRVSSDELTYPIHIIIRYEIEKGLFDGSVQVGDLPKVFNQKMKEYLGIEPDKDSNGVLQDIHWNFGAYGYFPSYLTGQLVIWNLFKFYSLQLKFLKRLVRKFWIWKRKLKKENLWN